MNTQARLFGILNLFYSCLGITSLVAIGILIDAESIVLVRTLFVYSSLSSVIALILNFHGLRRIREGMAGEYDLVFIRAGLFAAALSSMFWAAFILVMVVH